MALERRKRLEDGTFGENEKVGRGETPTEKIARLEDENISKMLAMADMFETNMQLQQDNLQLMMAVTDLYEILVGGNV